MSKKKEEKIGDLIEKAREKSDALAMKIDGQLVDSFSPQAATFSGQNLIRQAAQEIQGGYQDRVINFITATMEQITMLQYRIEEAKKAIDFARDRLQAIHNNQFSINSVGQIDFKEVRLNG